MKTALIAAVFTAVCVIPAFAADSASNSQGPRLSVEEMKAEFLQHIEQRNALGQQEKACTQAATSHDELRTCQEKFRPQRRNNRQDGKQ